ILATAVAAAFIFGPARRRLSALEEATDRLGSGDLTARAPETGGDEIAHVAGAFNRMASELAARDEALRTSDRLRRQMFADVSNAKRCVSIASSEIWSILPVSKIELDRSTSVRSRSAACSTTSSGVTNRKRRHARSPRRRRLPTRPIRSLPTQIESNR